MQVAERLVEEKESGGVWFDGSDKISFVGGEPKDAPLERLAEGIVPAKEDES